MTVKQISVFLENKLGRLAEVSELLAKEKINIRALSVADTMDFGVLRLIVNRPEEAYKILKESGFTVGETDVLAVEISDQPGGLFQVLKILDEENINLEYIYAFVAKASEDALVVMRVEDPTRASSVLANRGICILKGEQIYNL